MFETIFACLFRLYPSRFRKVYGDEARWLIRERFRDEKGLLRRSRLWLDLATDFAVSLPRAYRKAPYESAEASVVPNAAGIPTFHVLVEEKTGPGPFLGGSALSLAALCLFSFVMSLPGEQYVQPSEVGNPILGDWQGPLLASQNDLLTVVRIGETNAGDLHIVVYRSDRSRSPLLATSATFHDGELMFAIQSIGGRFEGNMSADGMSIAGIWMQATSSHRVRPVLLKRTPPA